jgi:hypothetical protein
LVEQTLYAWVRQERIDREERECTTTEMCEDNALLRRGNRQLRIEQGLLKSTFPAMAKTGQPTTRWLNPTKGPSVRAFVPAELDDDRPAP